MTSNRNPETAFRSLSRELAEAPERKILAVLSVVDALPRRGVADALIAPLRSRLPRMRAGRQVNFCRLLFTPFDRLIVPGPRWRPTDPTVPRTALTALADVVREELGARLAPVEAILAAGIGTNNPARIAETGALFWLDAGCVLLRAPAPKTWSETGLPDALYTPLARRIGAVLAHWPAIEALIRDAEDAMVPPDIAAAKAVLADIAQTNADAIGMVAALLLSGAPALRPLLPQAASQLGKAVELATLKACDGALDTVMEQLEAPGGAETQLSAGDLDTVAGIVRRIAGVLNDVEAVQTKTQERARFKALRDRLDASCRTRFTDGLENDLLAPLRTAPTDALEKTARGLRRLESEARVIGSGPVYDSLLRKAADTVEKIGTGSADDAVDQSRLIEILVGPEAALSFLSRQR